MTRSRALRHPKPCTVCRTPTYKRSQVCLRCEVLAKLPEVTLLPEDYLIRCAEELRRRHTHRAEALKAIGMLPEAA